MRVFLENSHLHFRVKSEPGARTKKGLHDLPLPPVLPEEEHPMKTPPSAAEKEQARRKRPRLV